jgi:hypothetical protein
MGRAIVLIILAFVLLLGIEAVRSSDIIRTASRSRVGSSS